MERAVPRRAARCFFWEVSSVCGDSGQASGNGTPASVAEALRMAGTGLAYLNSAAGDDLDPAALGEVLTALGDLQDKIAAAHATVLRRFDAADAHDADGYGSSSAWLAAKGRMTRRDARAAVRQMRQFSQRPRPARRRRDRRPVPVLGGCHRPVDGEAPRRAPRGERQDPARGRRGRGDA